MKNDGLEMPREVVKYLAYNINSNVRELEGALISLLAQSSLNKREIDLDLAKRVLRNFVKTSSKEITIETIQKMVCEYFDVSYDKLLQKTGNGKLCRQGRLPCTSPKPLPRIPSKQLVNILVVVTIPRLSTPAKLLKTSWILTVLSAKALWSCSKGTACRHVTTILIAY